VKKSITALLSAAALLCALFACAPAPAAPPAPVSLPTPAPETARPEPLAEAAEDRFAAYERAVFDTVDFSGYEDVFHAVYIARDETARFPEGATSVLLYAVAHYYTREEYENRTPDYFFHTPVLIIDTGEEIICHALGIDAYESELYLVDVDGDGYDEIISQNLVGIAGGAGSYNSYIYKWEDGALSQLFANDYETADYDSGFRLTLGDGYLHTVTNEWTGYQTAFTRTSEDPYFDKNGFARTDGEIWWPPSIMVDHFYLFEPIDIDGDGVFEIQTAQFCSLWGHSDWIGDAFAILRYNPETGELEVVRAAFFREPQEFDVNWYDADGASKK
jgi:hypothetical protein